MSNRGALLIAAALTAFVLVITGGIVGRLSKPKKAQTAPRAVLASRAPERHIVVRPAVRTWHEDDDDERHHGRRHEEHEEDDD